MFSNKKRRALHDYLAHSVVIRKEAFIIPELELEMEKKACYKTLREIVSNF